MAGSIVFTSKAAKPPLAYSQAVKAAGVVFVSGTAPHDPATGVIVGTTVQEQTRQCVTSIAAILEAAGSSLETLVCLLWCVRRLAEHAEVNGLHFICVRSQ